MRDVRATQRDPIAREAYSSLRTILAGDVGAAIELARVTGQDDQTVVIQRARESIAAGVIGTVIVDGAVDGGGVVRSVLDVPPQGRAVHVPSGLAIVRLIAAKAGDLISGAVSPGRPVVTRTTRRVDIPVGVTVVEVPPYTVAGRAQIAAGTCAVIVGGTQIPATAGPLDVDVSAGIVSLDTTTGATVILTWEVCL